VSGADFFNRDAELARLEQLLLMGEHVSLSAQRRTGKTSLLRHTATRLGGRLTCLYIDLQHARTAEQAIVAIALATCAHQKLWTRVRGSFTNVLGDIAELNLAGLNLKLASGVAGDWVTKGTAILADLAAADPPVVLMIDELPQLLVRQLKAGGGRADIFLSWLRRCVLEHQGRLRVVVTGSIGLAPIAHRAGLSATLNHYRPLALPQWPPHTSLAFLDVLARNYGLNWGKDAADEVVAQLGSGIPYHFQLLFSQIEEDARRRRSGNVSKHDVQRVYTTRMLSTHGHTELADMEERLGLAVAKGHHALTLDLLTEAAVVRFLTRSAALKLALDSGMERREAVSVLRDVLGILEHDGYLEPISSGHRFSSKLLRDWWHARFSAYYTPAEER